MRIVVWIGVIAWQVALNSVVAAAESTAVRGRPVRVEQVIVEQAAVLPTRPVQAASARKVARMRVADMARTVPVSTQPAGQKIELDDITISSRPLTDVSQSIVLRAATRDKSAPTDHATRYFESLPCREHGPGRVPEGLPSLQQPAAGDFCHPPLYFQECNLERYGNSRGALQPVISGARFFATLPALPYLMTVYRPRTCYHWEYPSQAGFPAPRVRELPPVDLRAALAEGGVVAGLLLVLP